MLQIWRRKSNELSYQWGTIGMTSMDEPRPNFRGAMGIDAISGKVQPQSPRYLTYVKVRRNNCSYKNKIIKKKCVVKISYFL